MGKKSPSANFYTFGRLYCDRNKETDFNSEYAYALGKVKGKLLRDDFGPNYCAICSRSIGYLDGFVKISGVTDVEYSPVFINHLFKDDYLYISYSGKVKKKVKNGIASYNADFRLCGDDIVRVIKAIHKNNPNLYEKVKRIRKKINAKAKWYYTTYPCKQVEDVEHFSVFNEKLWPF